LFKATAGRIARAVTAVLLFVLLSPSDAARAADSAFVANLRGGPVKAFPADSLIAIRFLKDTELNQRLSDVVRGSLEKAGFRPVSESPEFVPPKLILNVSVAVESKLALRRVGIAGGGGSRSGTNIQIDIRQPGASREGGSKNRYAVDIAVIDNTKRRQWQGTATAHVSGDRYAITRQMLTGLIERLGKKFNSDKLALR